jgi:hypothetical protein
LRSTLAKYRAAACKVNSIRQFGLPPPVVLESD